MRQAGLDEIDRLLERLQVAAQDLRQTRPAERQARTIVYRLVQEAVEAGVDTWVLVDLLGVTAERVRQISKLRLAKTP